MFHWICKIIAPLTKEIHWISGPVKFIMADKKKFLQKRLDLKKNCLADLLILVEGYAYKVYLICSNNKSIFANCQIMLHRFSVFNLFCLEIEFCDFFE